jgi:UDP-2,3-diacylglucosamine pyrophosphatase LpxH
VTSKEYSLFVLGDFWDLWRKRDIIYSTESDKVLSLVNRFKDVYYLPGSHDYITLDAGHNYPDFNCYTLANTLGLRVARRTSILFMGMSLR